MQGKQSAEGTTELTSFNPSPFQGLVAAVFESGVPFHYTPAYDLFVPSGLIFIYLSTIPIYIYCINNASIFIWTLLTS
jgi:hypothetical protein